VRGEATEPFFLHMRSLRVGALVPVCGCFHQLSTFRCRNMIVCNPLRNILLLVGAQRIESGLIIFWHILDVFLTFNLSCVFVQEVRFHEFRPLISLPKHDRL